MISHETKLTSCPKCGHAFECATALDGDENIAPGPNDLTVCIECGCWLRFTDDMNVRAMTPEEIEALPNRLARTLAKATFACQLVRARGRH